MFSVSSTKNQSEGERLWASKYKCVRIRWLEIYTCPSKADFVGKHYNTPYQGEKYNLKKLIDEVCAVQWTICHEQDDLPPLQIVYTPHVIDWYIIDIFSITMNEMKEYVFLCERIINLKSSINVLKYLSY